MDSFMNPQKGQRRSQSTPDWNFVESEKRKFLIIFCDLKVKKYEENYRF